MDDLIGSTGVGYRALTNPSLMDSLGRQADASKHQSPAGQVGAPGALLPS